MAVTTKPDTIVLMDDEIFNIQWLVDFLEAKGFEVISASDADSALRAISKEIYRTLILDLNVPISTSPQSGPGMTKTVYKKYPGLHVAWHARNQGYRGRQVIIYSVHRDPDVEQEARNLDCTYILKGRPTELKEEIAQVISYDPTASIEAGSEVKK